MTRQIHGRLTDEQVVAILSRYVRRELAAEQAMDMLGLGRSQFFEWVKKYKQGDPSMAVRSFNYSYVKDQIFKKYQQEVSVPTIIGRAKKTAFTSKSPRGSTTIGRSLLITPES